MIWRDSVCAGDDCNAPHELAWPNPEVPLGQLAAELICRHYLASIAGGQATWILHGLRPLAVLAQQWSEPRFLVDASTPVSAYLKRETPPHLNLEYRCQVDPDAVFNCLREGRPLPSKYGAASDQQD